MCLLEGAFSRSLPAKTDNGDCNISLYYGCEEVPCNNKRKEKSTPSGIMIGASVPRSSPRLSMQHCNGYVYVELRLC